MNGEIVPGEKKSAKDIVVDKAWVRGPTRNTQALEGLRAVRREQDVAPYPHPSTQRPKHRPQQGRRRGIYGNHEVEAALQVGGAVIRDPIVDIVCQPASAPDRPFTPVFSHDVGAARLGQVPVDP